MEIRIMKKEVGLMPYEGTMNHSLEAMQELVGGYIECVRLPNNVDLWINEEGLLIGLDFNFATFVIEKGEVIPVHQLMGNAFFASHDEEGNTIGLTDKQVDYIKMMFQVDEQTAVVAIR